MELWIRSQDKIRLIKTENLIIGGTYKNEIKEESDVFSMSLGTYKTKERALEVLDEIQRHLVITNDDNIFYVYQMPKE